LTFLSKNDIICNNYWGGYVELIIDGQEYYFSSQDLDRMYLDEGLEAEIYYFEGKALKIYKPYCRKNRLSEEDCKRMISIPTKNILLPKGILYNSDLKFVGYYTPYIESCSFQKVYDLKRDDFIQSIEPVYDDLKALSKEGISVADLNLPNCLYDGSIRFLDPGSYAFEEQTPRSLLYCFNREEFSNFVSRDIFSRVPGLSKAKKKLIERNFSGVDFIPEVLWEDALPEETVKKYVKRITS